MELNFILKIAGIALIVAVINQVLSKTGRDDYALLVSLSGIAVIIAMLLPKISNLLSGVKSLFDL
ncbi:MAG: stage III sporulation protein AC [Ruminococcaceae bacterium]|nr:stage III sporulation protein AC [Oscillospiraceae bacterium]